jgi:hypothetical protein
MTADHEPRNLAGATQSYCEQSGVWLMHDYRGNIIASATDQWPGLPIRERPRERRTGEIMHRRVILQAS